MVRSAATRLGSCRSQQQVAQEAQNTADAEAAAADLKQQLQEETLAAAEAASRSEDAAAHDAEARAVLLQQLQQALEQHQCSKVRVEIQLQHTTRSSCDTRLGYLMHRQPGCKQRLVEGPHTLLSYTLTQLASLVQEEAAALHQHAALLHARIDDLTAENDHLAARAAAGDAAVSRLQVRAHCTSSHSATHHAAPSVLLD